VQDRKAPKARKASTEAKVGCGNGKLIGTAELISTDRSEAEARRERAKFDKMEANDFSEVMEELFGGPAFTESRLFAYCITRGEMMLAADGNAGRTAGKSRGQAVFVPVVCGQCERAIGGLGEGAGKVEIDESVLKTTTAFERVEKWCGGKVEVVRQVQRVETIARAGAEYGFGMQTVVNRAGYPLEVTDNLKAGFV
jgi:hypothetical protein